MYAGAVILPRALELAEKYDVYMGSEIHRPTTIHTPHIDTYIEFIEKYKTKRFGFCLDFGTFQSSWPEEMMELFSRWDKEMTPKADIMLLPRMSRPMPPSSATASASSTPS